MDRVNKILNNKKYNELLNELAKIEKDRMFCKHSIGHFLDVARIAYIEVLEERLNYNKEVIYAIALLHDIGRVLEYKEGIDHNIASAEIAKDILKDIDFTKEQKDEIIRCIIEHRTGSENNLSQIIYKSDKLSRNCFKCDAKKFCKWNENKRNKEIKF